MVWEAHIVVETTKRYVRRSFKTTLLYGKNRSTRTLASRRSLPSTVFVKVVSRTAQWLLRREKNIGLASQTCTVPYTVRTDEWMRVSDPHSASVP